MVFESQIISADKILLNKTDLISNKDDISEIKCFVNEINPFAEIHETTYSEIPIEYLTDNQDLVEINEIEHKHHHSSIENIVIECKINELDVLDKKIGHILWDYATEYNFEIIRFKGIIYIESKKYLLNGLYDLYEFEELKAISDNTQNSKILFIGKNLVSNKALLYKLLNN
jgi:G3E family GTPase